MEVTSSEVVLVVPRSEGTFLKVVTGCESGGGGEFCRKSSSNGRTSVDSVPLLLLFAELLPAWRFLDAPHRDDPLWDLNLIAGSRHCKPPNCSAFTILKTISLGQRNNSPGVVTCV